MSNRDSGIVEELDRENKELKASIMKIRIAGSYFSKEGTTGNMFNLLDAIDITPSQSLADIKADAIEEMINEVPLMGANTLCISEIDDYIDKLRGKP